MCAGLVSAGESRQNPDRRIDLAVDFVLRFDERAQNGAQLTVQRKAIGDRRVTTTLLNLEKDEI